MPHAPPLFLTNPRDVGFIRRGWAAKDSLAQGLKIIEFFCAGVLRAGSVADSGSYLRSKR